MSDVLALGAGCVLLFMLLRRNDDAGDKNETPSEPNDKPSYKPPIPDFELPDFEAPITPPSSGGGSRPPVDNDKPGDVGGGSDTPTGPGGSTPPSNGIVPGIPEEKPPVAPPINTPSDPDYKSPSHAALEQGLELTQPTGLRLYRPAWSLFTQPSETNGLFKTMVPRYSVDKSAFAVQYAQKTLSPGDNAYAVVENKYFEECYGDVFDPDMFVAWNVGLQVLEPVSTGGHIRCNDHDQPLFAVDPLKLGGRVFEDMDISTTTLRDRLGDGLMGRRVMALGWVDKGAHSWAAYDKLLRECDITEKPWLFSFGKLKTPVFPATSWVVDTGLRGGKNLIVKVRSNRVLLYGISEKEVLFFGQAYNFMTLPTSGYSMRELQLGKFQFIEIVALNGYLALHFKRNVPDLKIYN